MKEFLKYIVTILFNGETRSVVIDKPSFIIGRSSEADITLDYELLSRKHLKIINKDQEIFLEELGSSNGSWLEGVKLKSKKTVSYLANSKIILGNNQGPVITIEVLFIETAKDVTEEKSEEITLVKRNPLLDQLKVESNVIVLRSEQAVEKKIIEPIIQKVSNGNDQILWQENTIHESTVPTSKIRLVDNAPSTSTAAPDLVLRIKNILNSEAESFLANAKTEAEQIIQDAKNKANASIEQAKTESNAIKCTIEYEKKLAYKAVNDEIANLKQENAKIIGQLHSSAKRKSHEALKASKEEADTIRNSAKQFANDLISTNKEKAASTIKETDHIVQLKLHTLKQSEEEIQLNINSLEEIYRELKAKVDSLKQRDYEAKTSYEALTKSIELDEARINSERSSLESLRTQVLNSEKECEQKLANLHLEEKRLKTQMETELLEQKLKVTQVLSEFQQAQIPRDTIAAEINFLKLDKAQNERLIRDTDAEYKKVLQRFDNLKADEALAKENLIQIQHNQKNIQIDIENQQNDLNIAHEELQLEKNKIADFKKKTETYASQLAEAIKNENFLLEKQKRKMALEIENENTAFEKHKWDLATELEKEKQMFQKQKINLAEELEKEKQMFQTQKINLAEELEKEKQMLQKQKINLAEELEKEKQMLQKHKINLAEELEKEKQMLQKQKTNLAEKLEEEKQTLENKKTDFAHKLEQEKLTLQKQKIEFSKEIEKEKQILKHKQQVDLAKELEKEKQTFQAQSMELSEELEKDKKTLEKKKIRLAEELAKEQQTLQKQKMEFIEELEKEKQTLQKQTMEFAEELNNEKKKLSKELKDELHRNKLEHEEEIKKITEYKNQSIMIVNEVNLENERLKAEAHRVFLQEKKNLDQIIEATNRDHEELRNLALLDLKRIDKEKENIQKEIQELGYVRELQLNELEHELILETEKAQAKAAQLEQEIATKTLEQRIALEEFQQSEMHKIQQTKESALKDIVNKKNDQVKGISIAVDSVVLSELNKYKFAQINDEFIVNFSNEISNIVFETLMDRYAPDKHKLDKAKREAAKKMKRVNYFKSMFKGSLLVLFFIVLSYTTFHFLTSSGFIPIKNKIGKKFSHYLQ